MRQSSKQQQSNDTPKMTGKFLEKTNYIAAGDPVERILSMKYSVDHSNTEHNIPTLARRRWSFPLTIF